MAAGKNALDEASLAKKLEKGGVDVSRFGKEDAKTLYEFAQELQRGQSYLEGAGSGLTRVVDVVLLKIQRDSDDTILTEASRHQEKTGKTKESVGYMIFALDS